MVEGVAVADAGAETEGGGKAEREVIFEGFIGSRQRSGDRESRELYKEVGDSEEGASPREQQELSQERRPRESVWPRVQNIRLT